MGKLDQTALNDIQEVRRSIRPVRGSANKLRSIFNDTFLADEWTNTSDLTMISGVGRLLVYKGLVELHGDEEIMGKSYTRLEYYESFRGRTDRAARLLVALASARMDCPEDEVSLATMTLPDVKRTDAEGVERIEPASGFYWRRRSDEGPAADDIPFDIPAIELTRV